MNPCPCGFLGHPEKPCRDTTAQIERYRHKISGPLLDRIDLHLAIPPVAYDDMVNTKPEESSLEIRKRVICARECLKNNPPLSPDAINNSCKSLMREAIKTMGISARAHQRILKVAYTIARLSQSSTLEEDHLIEALSYRSF